MSISPTEIAPFSPRSVDALTDLQRRQRQAAAAKNQAEASKIFARRDLYLATQRHDVKETLRFTRAFQGARAAWDVASADYAAVLEEIEELIAAETAVAS